MVKQADEYHASSLGDEAGVLNEGDVKAQWQNVQARLKTELGADVFRSWFGGLSLLGCTGGRVAMEAPSKFKRDWIVSHYEDRLRHGWAQENPAITCVELSLASERKSDARVSTQGLGARHSSATEEAKPSGAPQHLRHVRENNVVEAPSLPDHASCEEGSLSAPHVGAPIDTQFTFDHFVVGKSNELAYAAARRVAEAPAGVFNPLYLYGQVGIGKTHLLHAIAWEVRRRNPGAKTLYLSAERFMYRFVQALRDKTVMNFKDEFRGVDVLLLDDIQFIANKGSTQEEFFHTFDALMGMNRQVVISSDRAPSELDGVEERIRSRLGQGLAVDIHATDYDLRLGILERKLRQVTVRAGADVKIPGPVIEFLAHRISSNVRVLEGALNRIAAHATLVRRPVSVEMATEILSDLLRASDRKISIDDIQRCVTKYYSLSMADLLSPRRARDVARPRQVAMYLCKKLTSRSLPEIGRKFGGRDHTTVMHAVRRIEGLCAEDEAICKDIEALKHQLQLVIAR